MPIRNSPLQAVEPWSRFAEAVAFVSSQAKPNVYSRRNQHLGQYATSFGCGRRQARDRNVRERMLMKSRYPTKGFLNILIFSCNSMTSAGGAWAGFNFNSESNWSADTQEKQTE